MGNSCAFRDWTRRPFRHCLEAGEDTEGEESLGLIEEEEGEEDEVVERGRGSESGRERTRSENSGRHRVSEYTKRWREWTRRSSTVAVVDCCCNDAVVHHDHSLHRLAGRSCSRHSGSCHSVLHSGFHCTHSLHVLVPGIHSLHVHRDDRPTSALPNDRMFPGSFHAPSSNRFYCVVPPASRAIRKKFDRRRTSFCRRKARRRRLPTRSRASPAPPPSSDLQRHLITRLLQAQICFSQVKTLCLAYEAHYSIHE